jgi:hypothetical protein
MIASGLRAARKGSARKSRFRQLHSRLAHPGQSTHRAVHIDLRLRQLDEKPAYRKLRDSESRRWSKIPKCDLRALGDYFLIARQPGVIVIPHRPIVALSLGLIVTNSRKSHPLQWKRLRPNIRKGRQCSVSVLSTTRFPEAVGRRVFGQRPNAHLVEKLRRILRRIARRKGSKSSFRLHSTPLITHALQPLRLPC